MADFDARRRTMVDTQVRPSDVTLYPILDTLLAVPREMYVPQDARDIAYQGDHIHVGDTQLLLDARLFAKMLQAADVNEDDVVLDIGAALGYSTAIISRLASFVVGVVDDETTADEAQTLLSENGHDNAAIVSGDLHEGAAKSGPYSVIIIEGGVETVPDTLVDQLQDGGRIVAIFMEDNLGTVRVGHKLNGTMNWRYAFNGAAPVLSGFKQTVEFSL